MNSKAHDKVAPHLKRAIIKVRLIGFSIGLAFVAIGLLPPSVGFTGAAISIIELTLKLSFPHSNASQNFQNFQLSCVPFWVLLQDPCSLVYAQYLSLVHARNLALEENRKKSRTFFYLLLIANWLFVILFKSFFFDECTTPNLRKDAGVVFGAIYLTYSAMAKQIHVILGELKGTLSKVQDLNSKLETVNKELQQSLDDKDNFILLFSHETRNPLNILIGNLTLLLDEAENTQHKSKLEKCKFCADLLLQQLNNILDSGKLSSRGALELSPTPVNISDYVLSISSFMDMMVKRKSAVKSEVIIPEGLPTTLRFDMQRFTQVCLNLLTNGLKFTDAGLISMVIRYLRKDELQETDYLPSSDFGYRIMKTSTKKETSSNNSNEIGEEFALETQLAIKPHFTREIANLSGKKKIFQGVDAPEKGFLKVEINDTGCGVKAEHLKQLFKKFSQTHSDASQLKLGSGLGLWITKTLCELMGGDVKAYSIPNVGSSFVAIIQADCLPSAYPRLSFSHNLSNSSPVKDQNPRRILLVDDDPFNLEFHTHIIKSLGYKAIETAIDGQQLVEQFKKRPEGYFDAVITDISMPNLDGIGAAKLIRKFEEEEKRGIKVKIGFITGHSNIRDKMLCERDLGCWFYLAKPIKSPILEGFLPPLKRDSRDSPLTLPNKKVSMSLNKTEPFSSTDYSAKKLSRAQMPASLSSSDPLVLCVDHDMLNLDFMEELLRSLGARTILAGSGEEALAIVKSAVSENVKEKIPSFVLMACRMPKMDGWAASKLIKEMLKQHPRLEIPIIGTTGDDKHQYQEKLSHSGMEGILRKPIQKEELQALVLKYT